MSLSLLFMSLSCWGAARRLQDVYFFGSMLDCTIERAARPTTVDVTQEQEGAINGIARTPYRSVYATKGTTDKVHV